MVKAMSIGDLFKKIAGRKSLSDFGKKRGGIEGAIRLLVLLRILDPFR
jgi:hypothetical protein